ncbi:MAG: DUF4386 family protein [Frankia sp.]
MSTPVRPGPTLSPALLLCLVAAPLVAVIARLLSVPWVDDPAEFLADVSAHPARSDAGGLLAMVSATLMIPAGLTLAATVRTHRPRLAAAGAAMTVIGATALADAGAVALVAGQLARRPERVAMVPLWDRIHNFGAGDVVFLALIVGAVGYLVLAVGLYRSRVAPLPAAALVGLGGVGIMLTAPGPARPVIIGVAVLALAGFSWVAAAVRSRDDQDSAPRPHPAPSTVS